MSFYRARANIYKVAHVVHVARVTHVTIRQITGFIHNVIFVSSKLGPEFANRICVKFDQRFKQGKHSSNQFSSFVDQQARRALEEEASMVEPVCSASPVWSSVKTVPEKLYLTVENAQHALQSIDRESPECIALRGVMGQTAERISNIGISIFGIVDPDVMYVLTQSPHQKEVADLRAAFLKIYFSFEEECSVGRASDAKKSVENAVIVGMGCLQYMLKFEALILTLHNEGQKLLREKFRCGTNENVCEAHQVDRKEYGERLIDAKKARTPLRLELLELTLEVAQEAEENERYSGLLAAIERQKLGYLPMPGVCEEQADQHSIVSKHDLIVVCDLGSVHRKV